MAWHYWKLDCVALGSLTGFFTIRVQIWENFQSSESNIPEALTRLSKLTPAECLLKFEEWSSNRKLRSSISYSTCQLYWLCSVLIHFKWLHVSLCLYHVSFRLNFLNKFPTLLAKQSVAKMLILLYLHPDRYIFVVRKVISIQQNECHFVLLLYKWKAKYEIGESLTLVHAEIEISTNYNLGLGVFLLFFTGK